MAISGPVHDGLRAANLQNIDPRDFKIHVPSLQVLACGPEECPEGDHRRGALIGSPGTFDSATTYCNMEGPVGFVPNLLEAPTGASEHYHWPLPPYGLSSMETHCTVLEATAGLWCLRPPTYSSRERVIRT